MPHFLITGSRAPAALEIVRNLHSHGHKVYTADSLRYPLCAGSRAVQKNYKIADPRTNLHLFAADLTRIILDHQIDVLIPTCEEVFYISRVRESLPVNCKIFTDDFPQMRILHSKIAALDYAKAAGFLIPFTEVFTVEEAFLKRVNFDFYSKIVKPEFTRFGVDILDEPSPRKFAKYLHDRKGNILVQEKIRGREVCIYGIALRGDLKVSVIYEPGYRFRKSASIYYSLFEDSDIKKRLSDFCRKYQIHGQISLDLMLTPEGPYFLECNPRATSGVHLLYKTNFSEYFLGGKNESGPSSTPPAMLGSAMLLLGLPKALFKGRLKDFINDYRNARDIIKSYEDRSFSLLQIKSLIELICIALKKGISLRTASTWDIEWGGENIVF